MELDGEEDEMNAEASGSGSPVSTVGNEGKMSKSSQKKAAKQVSLSLTASAFD